MLSMEQDFEELDTHIEEDFEEAASAAFRSDFEKKFYAMKKVGDLDGLKQLSYLNNTLFDEIMTEFLQQFDEETV